MYHSVITTHKADTGEILHKTNESNGAFISNYYICDNYLILYGWYWGISCDFMCIYDINNLINNKIDNKLCFKYLDNNSIEYVDKKLIVVNYDTDSENENDTDNKNKSEYTIPEFINEFR